MLKTGSSFSYISVIIRIIGKASLYEQSPSWGSAVTQVTELVALCPGVAWPCNSFSCFAATCRARGAGGENNTRAVMGITHGGDQEEQGMLSSGM